MVAKEQEQLRREAEREREERRRKIQSGEPVEPVEPRANPIRLHQVENVDIDPRSNRMRAFPSDNGHWEEPWNPIDSSGGDDQAYWSNSAQTSYEHWEAPWNPIDSSGGDDQAYWSNSAQTSGGANAQLSQRKQTGGSSGAVPKPKRREANAEAHSKSIVWRQRIYANEQGNWQARK
jgi:hypothetical protein